MLDQYNPELMNNLIEVEKKMDDAIFWEGIAPVSLLYSKALLLKELGDLKKAHNICQNVLHHREEELTDTTRLEFSTLSLDIAYAIRDAGWDRKVEAPDNGEKNVFGIDALFG